MTFDLTKIKPEAAEWVAPTVDNPAREWVRDSFDNDGAARQIPVPADQAKTVVNMLNVGAKLEELGVAIRIRIGNEEFAASTELWDAVDKLGDKTVTIKYRGRKRAKRPRKNTTGTTQNNTPTTGQPSTPATTPAPTQTPAKTAQTQPKK